MCFSMRTVVFTALIITLRLKIIKVVTVVSKGQILLVPMLVTLFSVIMSRLFLTTYATD